MELRGVSNTDSLKFNFLRDGQQKIAWLTVRAWKNGSFQNAINIQFLMQNEKVRLAVSASLKNEDLL